MPRHSETRIVPYTPTQVFDLVADIESYPDFLPWCKAAHIIEEKSDGVVADLVVGNQLLSERFRSNVVFDRPNRIGVEHCGGGVLDHLENEWCLTPLVAGGCEIHFMVNFTLRSRVFSGLMNAFFDKAFIHMVQAFELEMSRKYGKKPTHSGNL